MQLSLVVICFNMRRELPRTIRSLSPSMQRDIAATDYEVIIVDNGSTSKFDPEECRRWIPDVTIHHMSDPSPSPVQAINHGLKIASGDLIARLGIQVNVILSGGFRGGSLGSSLRFCGAV